MKNASKTAFFVKISWKMPVYNAQGQVEKTVESAVTTSATSTISTTFYSYDTLGDLLRTAQDLNANGQPDLAADRITEKEGLPLNL